MEANVENRIPKAATIHKIYQTDLYTFSIEWSDGEKVDYRLSQLQRQCPCAGCLDETSPRPSRTKIHVDERVQAIKIVNVGRYALRIEFTTGCSKGIYSFDILRKWLDSSEKSKRST